MSKLDLKFNIVIWNYYLKAAIPSNLNLLHIIKLSGYYSCPFKQKYL